jgi:hypothetical protein
MSGKKIVKRDWMMAALVAGAATAGVAATPLGCSSSQSDNAGNGQSPGSTTGGNESGTGTVGFALSLPDGAVISSITYDLTNGGTAVVLPSRPRSAAGAPVRAARRGSTSRRATRRT